MKKLIVSCSTEKSSNDQYTSTLSLLLW